MIWNNYPYSHAFWSTVISVIVSVLCWQVLGLPMSTPWPWLVGSVFYGLREVWQWKAQGKAWDQPGWNWGVWPMSIWFAVLSVLAVYS